MAKIFNYTVLLVGLLILLNFAGLPTASSELLKMLGYNSLTGITSSTFYIEIIALLAAAVGGAIAIGIFTKQSTESIIVAPFAALLLAWSIADAVSIITYVNSFGLAWLTFIMTLIFVPLIAGYFIAIVQWWRGNDI